MNKQWFIIFFLSICPVLAQKGITVGLKGGVNFSSWYGAEVQQVTDASGTTETLDPYEDCSRKTGLNIGGFLGIKLSEWFEIQPEILYSQKGMKKLFSRKMIPNQPSSWEVTNKIGYLEIPLLFKISLHSLFGINIGNLLFYTGPVYALKTELDMSIEADGFQESIPSKEKQILNDCTRKSDFCVTVGVMDIFGKGRIKLIADFRYTHGLIEIFDTMEPLLNSLAEEDNDEILAAYKNLGIPKHKNRNISILLGLGYEF